MDDWLWTPLLDPTQVGLALGALAVLVVFGVLALWPVRFPGEIAAAERARLRGSGWVGKLLAWGAFVVPVLLVAGVALLFFPLTVPQTVLLSSRARPLTPDAPTAWADRWAHLAAAQMEEGIDLGPIVDAVCERLLDGDAAGEAWRPDDPGLRQRVRKALRAVLTDVSISAVPTSAVTHRAEVRLPRWLVETVELAVLKAYGQRNNVCQYVLLLSDRKTDTGYAWDALEPYLHAGSARLNPAGIQAERQREPAYARLDRVIEARPLEAGGWVVRCIIVVPAGRVGQTTEVRLRLQWAGGKAGTLQSQTLTLDEQPRLWSRDVTFPAGGGGGGGEGAPTALLQVGEPPVSRPIPRSRASSAVVIRLKVHAEATDLWLQTWNTLQTDAAFKGWRERMAEFGHAVADVRLSTDAGDVVLDAESHPGSVWVYPASRESSELPRVVGVPRNARDPVRAASNNAAGSGSGPGLYAWEGLPLRGQEAIMQVRDGDGTASASQRSIVRLLKEGAVPGRERSSPLVTQHLESCGEETHLALDPVLQDALLPLEEPARAAVIWTALLDACRRSQLSSAAVEVEQNEDAPLLLLESEELQAYRAEALVGNLLPLLGGLLLFAGIVARGVANAPRRNHVVGETGRDPEGRP